MTTTGLVTAGDAIDRIRVITGDKNKAQFSDAEIMNWITDAQYRLVQRIEAPQWEFIASTIAGQYSYTLTPGYLKIREVKVNDQIVNVTTSTEILRLYPSLPLGPPFNRYPTGQPIWWWITEDVDPGLNMYPAPGITGQQIWGIKLDIPTALTTTTSALVITPDQLDTLVLMCLQRAKEWDTDYEGARYFDQMADKRMGEDSYNQQVRQIQTYPNVRQLPTDEW